VVMCVCCKPLRHRVVSLLRVISCGDVCVLRQPNSSSVNGSVRSSSSAKTRDKKVRSGRPSTYCLNSMSAFSFILCVFLYVLLLIFKV